jgi:DNA polymerase I
VIQHLQETKNLTDVVVCFDGANNHRKELTKDWEFGYKYKRSDKDAELVVQLQAMPDRLREINLPCVRIDGMEADDVMASYAVQFPGKTTLMTADKDLRQCLGPKCNILRDVQWETHPETGKLVRTFDWVSAKKHIEEGVKYGSTMVVGITPELWPHFQAIAGDPTDDIKGCEGIGGKGAMDLIHAHGTVQNVIAAVKAGTANLTKKKAEAVLDFEPIAETTLLLTTMRNDLSVPMVTRLAMKEPEK